jgi:acetoacetate decarboxylase
MKTSHLIKTILLFLCLAFYPVLIFAEFEPNDDWTTANLLISGNTNGELSTTDTEDWYKIIITDDSKAEFTFQTDNVLRIRSLTLFTVIDNNPGIRNDIYFWSFNGNVTFSDLAKGTYYLRVLRGEGNGTYSLNYTLTNVGQNDSEPNNNYSAALLLNDEQPVNGHLGFYNIANAPDRDTEDWYKIEVPDNSKAEFSFETDNVLRMYFLTLYVLNSENQIEVRNNEYFWSLTGSCTIPDLAAGTYYIRLLWGEGFGKYTLNYNLTPNRLKNDPEPNDDFKHAVRIEDNQTVTGHLGYYHLPNAPDRDRQDWYEINITDNVAADITFQTDSVLRMFYLTLYTIEDDSTIKVRNEIYYWSYNGNMTVRDLSAGKYYLRLLYGEGYGNYTLTYKTIANPANNDPEPNNDYTQAVLIQSGETLPGKMGFEYSGNKDVQDWYRFTLPVDGKAEFSFQTDNVLRLFYLTIYSQTPEGEVKIRNDKYFWSWSGNMVIPDMAAGTYYIKLLYGQGYGDYKLTYNFTPDALTNDKEPNENYKNAVLLEDNQPVTGHLGYYYLHDASDRDVNDWYKIVITDNSKAEITFKTDSILRMKYVTLYSATSDTTVDVRNNNYYWDFGGSWTIADLAAGTYYIRMNYGEGYGNYTLNCDIIPNALKNDKEPNNNFRNAVLLEDNQTVTGHLGYYYSPNAPDRDIFDWYKITVNDNSKAEITFNTDSILRMFFVTLYSATSDTTVEVRNNNYCWNFGSKWTIADLAAGTYYIRMYYGEGYGNYTLNCDIIPNALKNDKEPNDNFKNAVLLEDNQPVTGHLGYYYLHDASDRDVNDWYKIVVTDNSKAEITFKTDSILRMKYVTLYSATSDTTVDVRNNNYYWDFGGSWTIADLAAGTYYIRMNYGEGYGNYTLNCDIINIKLKNDNEPNNDFKEAILLEDGQAVSGHLGYYYLTDAADRDVFDWYRIEIKQNAKTEFTFQTDSILRMYFMTLYTKVNDSTIQIRNDLYSWDYYGKLTVYDLTPGTYYLRLFRGESFGYYTLSYNAKYFVTGFEIARYNNTVKIINKSNCDSFEWDFGDGYITTAKFPEHTYNGIGDFVITQIAKVDHSSFNWITKDTISIKGIERFTPDKAGNGGDLMMTVYGGGLNKNTLVKLISGNTVIEPNEILTGRLGKIDVIFDLHLANPGVYDVSVGFAGETPVIFKNGLKIEGINYPHTVVSSIEGYENLRTGREWGYNLVLTNKGNVMAKGVNAWIAVPDIVEFNSQLKPLSSTIDITKSFVYHDDELNKDFSVSYSKVKDMMNLLRTNYVKIDTLFGEPFKGKAYPVYIPVIPANSTVKIPFTVKSISSSVQEFSSLQSFVLPVNMFGSCGSPMSTEMVNKLVDVMLANLDKLPIVDKNPYLKTFVKVTNISKTAIRNAASYFGYLSGGMSSDEAYYQAYISEGQLDQANAEVVSGLIEWGAELGLDKLKNVSLDQLNQYKADRLYYLKKALQENKNGDKFGVQLYKGFALDNNNRFERLKELRDLLLNVEKLKTANGLTNDFSGLWEQYLKDCPELNNQMNTFDTYKNDYSGYTDLLIKPLNIGTSVDPNDITGPLGFTSNRFINNSQTMNYVIRFENKAEAPLAAQIVNVYDTLDVNKFDIKTLELSDITIGDSVIRIPRGRDTYFTKLDLRPINNLKVSISVSTDTITGIVHWQFVSLDPETNDLTGDPLLGFLPPNKTAPEGEGSVSFSVKLKTGLNNMENIPNRANIIFDFNKPIITNLWSNKIDNSAPVGSVNAVNQVNDSVFTVYWSGNDTGSQIRYVELYGSKDNSSFTSLGKFSGNQMTFRGDVHSTYRFCVVPVDSVGNIQAKEIITEGSVTLNPSATPHVESVDKLIIIPVPVKDIMHLKFKNTSLYDIYSVELISMSGSVNKMGNYSASELNTGISLKMNNYPKGLYYVRIIGTETIISRKITLQ